MKTYFVTVRFTDTAEYRIKAENEEDAIAQAKELGQGELEYGVLDELKCEVVSIKRCLLPTAEATESNN